MSCRRSLARLGGTDEAALVVVVNLEYRPRAGGRARRSPAAYTVRPVAERAPERFLLERRDLLELAGDSSAEAKTVSERKTKAPRRATVGRRRRGITEAWMELGDAMVLLFLSIVCILILARFCLWAFQPGDADAGQERYVTGADYEPTYLQALRNSDNLGP